MQRYVVRPGALAMLIVAALISLGCGTASQAPGNTNSLALSNSLPGGTVNQSYNAVLSVSGGTSPYQFSVTSGALPAGISLNPATGSVTGTPSAAGNYTFTVMVTDSPNPGIGKQTYSVIIGNGGIQINISPTNVTLSPGGNQQFTATVTGTANTAVTWSATAGSVTTSGLFTAPTVNSTTSAAITATSQADLTQSAKATITINTSSGQSPTITTSSLPQGPEGEAYAAGFTATGGTQPYSWSVTSGSLPAGIALNANGELGGTPTTVGTASFSVTVTDAKGGTASGAFQLAIVSASGYDGPAQLPLVTVPSSMADSPAPGTVINVKSGGDLQSALNNAQCGQTIQLQAGATFTGTFTLPAKNCNDSNWILIRTSSPDSALPAEGQRLTPCYAGVGSLPGRPAYNCPNPTNVLAKVQGQNAANGPFNFASGANFYRFIGLEITRAPGAATGILMLLDGTADHIIVDRSWLHGQPQDETRNGFDLSGGTYIAIVDSYFNDFHCIANTGSCTDAHAISGGISETQDGPYLIQNNFLEASGEAIMFGGGPATKTPTDIEVIGNHLFKPWQWMKGNTPFVGGPDGNPFIVKNHFELKNAVRVLFEANLMDNCWGGFTQNGFAVVLSPTNQHARKSGDNVCPLCQVTDVTVRYSQSSHSGGGTSLSTSISPNKTEGAPALAGTRWSLHDLVFDDISKNYFGEGTGFKIANGWPKNPLNTVTINHVTAFPDVNGHLLVVGNFAGDPEMYGLVFTNNLGLTGEYPVWNAFGAGAQSCSARDVPLTSIENCFSTYTFQSNGLIASPAHYPPSSWPTSNFFPANSAAVQFVNYNNGNGGNYELLSSSPYKNKGTDGKDLGADIVGLDAALAGVE